MKAGDKQSSLFFDPEDECDTFFRKMIDFQRTNSMALSTSRVAASCAATQDFPSICGTQTCITPFITALH
jgi:hypothetical protein